RVQRATCPLPRTPTTTGTRRITLAPPYDGQRWSTVKVPGLAARRLDHQIGRQAEQEPAEHTPQREDPREASPAREQLPDHVQDRSRGEGQEPDEHVLGAERRPDDRPEEGRTTGAEARQQAPSPRRLAPGAGERPDNPEPLAGVLAREAH